jgi:hypothetical protein
MHAMSGVSASLELKTKGFPDTREYEMPFDLIRKEQKMPIQTRVSST